MYHSPSLFFQTYESRNHLMIQIRLGLRIFSLAYSHHPNRRKSSIDRSKHLLFVCVTYPSVFRHLINFFNGLKSYGTFSINHFTNEKLNEENIISNRCYPGYSYNNNLFSFVHGNVLAKYSDIDGGKKVKTDIIKTSFLQNHTYKIQKYFADFEKSELFFANPTSLGFPWYPSAKSQE